MNNILIEAMIVIYCKISIYYYFKTNFVDFFYFFIIILESTGIEIFLIITYIY